MSGYVKRHWLGQQSLAWSFWFNLVGIRSIVFVLQNALAPAEGSDLHAYRHIVLIAVCLFHVVLLFWQVVGVVRSAESHYAQHGTMALVWGTQIGAVLMFLLTAVYALGAIQMTMKQPGNIDVLAQMDAEHASQYTFKLSAEGHSVHIDGLIELGITRAFKTYLLEHPVIDTVILASSGGNIYEARGLAMHIDSNALNTHVDTVCASACTIAYVGGDKRSAGKKSTFGFHQYSVQANYVVIATDVAKEQSRDEQLLLEAGVSARFVEEIFSYPPESMWWPDLKVLHESGFLHTIGSLKQKAREAH